MAKAYSNMSLTSQGDIDFRQLFTCVGTYKGTIVAIRKVNKKHVELTRNVRKELKVVSHGHIILFCYVKQETESVMKKEWIYQ